MNKEFWIIQVNLKNSREALHALHYDEAPTDFHFILIQEPRSLLVDGQARLPGTNPRDVIITQLQADSADITAVVAPVGWGRVMTVSVYIPDLYSRRAKEENLEELTGRLNWVNGSVQRELLRDPHTEVVIAGDFHRHNPLWEGGHISSALRQEESAPHH
ncbi:hypothetical protein DL769_004096 [Monosporascus sp. CRB-8-3]|nr:hypothetical protein DL769_004096 [Monosporascus sp. CRB-8-3]